MRIARVFLTFELASLFSFCCWVFVVALDVSRWTDKMPRFIRWLTAVVYEKKTNKLCVTSVHNLWLSHLIIFFRYSNVITAAVVTKKSEKFRVCPALPAAVHAKCVIAIGSVSCVRRLYSRRSSTSFAPKSKANPFTKPFVQLAPTWNSSFFTCRDFTMMTKNYFTAVCQLSAHCVHLFFDAQWDSSYKVRFNFE